MTTDGTPIVAEPGGEPIPEGILADIILNIFAVLGSVITVPGAAASANAELVRQRAMSEARPTLLDPPSVIEAERRGHIAADAVAQILTRHGLSTESQQLLGLLARQLLGGPEIVRLWLRGELTDEQRDARLSRVGFEGREAEGLVELARFIPGPGEVIRLAVRDVFNTEARQVLRLDEDNPLDDPVQGVRVRALIQASGMDVDTFGDAWGAHWVLPGLRELFEMWARNPETGVTETDVDIVLRAADVLPRFRGPLKAIAKRPLTRVDVRRMYRLGVLDADGVKRAYLDLEYNDDRAQQLTDFTVRLEGGGEDDTGEKLRNSLQSQIRTAYLNSTIGDVDAAELLQSLGMASDTALAFIDEAESVRSLRLADDIRDRVRDFYIRGFWTAEVAADRLRLQGFDEPQIERLFEVWQLQRELREESTDERAGRDLTRSDILGAFGDNIVTREEAADFLLGLRYDAEEVTLLMERAELQKGREIARRTERVVEANLKAGRIDVGEARAQLGAADVVAARVEALVTQWSAEADADVRILTPSQLTEAAEAGLLSEADARQRLMEAGYTGEDADILLALRMGDAEPEEETAP